jgi:hypothetical protein
LAARTRRPPFGWHLAAAGSRYAVDIERLLASFEQAAC